MGVAVTLFLMRIIFLNLTARIDRFENKVDDRLRTLTHEDRDIRTQIASVTKLLIQVMNKKDG